MSDLLIRQLAEACAPRIAPAVEAAVVATVRTELPLVIDAVLREMFQGESIKLYISKKPRSVRKMRNDAIRAEYNGNNVKALAKKHGIAPRTVYRILFPR